MNRLPQLAATTIGLVGLSLFASAKSLPDLDAATLRDQGPAGLERALRTGDDALIDAVAGQRHARWSRLFWHTDLDAAKRAAEAEGKPILSLRLLGDLREEYTCANSRFFRTVLYSNPEIADVLREEFVLHWSNERDVPVVTIEFGDGRTLRRTITGNSIHYVLDSDGTPIDALPGLYGPEAFQGALDQSRALFGRIAENRDRRQIIVAQHHTAAAQVEARQLLADLGKVRGEEEQVVLGVEQDGAEVRLAVIGAPDDQRARLEQARVWMRDARGGTDAVPPAIVPMRLAVSKAAVEMPILVSIDGRDEPSLVAGMPVGSAWTPPQTHEWDDLATLHPASLHARSRALIRTENPAGPLGGEADAMFARLEADLAEDTVRNTFVMRPRIRAWLAEGGAMTLEQLNRRVYDELFATPASDPWLGLVDSTVYTGLDDAGWVGSGE